MGLNKWFSNMLKLITWKSKHVQRFFCCSCMDCSKKTTILVQVALTQCASSTTKRWRPPLVLRCKSSTKLVLSLGARVGADIYVYHYPDMRELLNALKGTWFHDHISLHVQNIFDFSWVFFHWPRAENNEPNSLNRPKTNGVQGRVQPLWRDVQQTQLSRLLTPTVGRCVSLSTVPVLK